jgi:hypothetical protein
MDWARHLQKVRKGKQNEIIEPYSVGAVIDLGYCLDLVSATGIEFVKDAYTNFKEYMEESGGEMPQNKGGTDLLCYNVIWTVGD